MQTATALWNHVREHDLCPGARSLDEWRRVSWLKVRLRGRVYPLFPVLGYREALHLHDVNHVLTGYSTRLPGELDLAVWELASGGCGWNVLMWIDRLAASTLAFLVQPRRSWRAARRGARCRNVYGRRIDDVLATDLEVLRRELGLGLPERAGE